MTSVGFIFEQIKIALNSRKPIPKRWGWKEPNSHIILSQLIGYFPDLRYIHVISNGLDMAYGLNQNQTKLWGSEYVNKPYEAGPEFSLSYW